MAGSTRLITVADTGAIYALIDASDAWHQRVVAWWTLRPRRVVLPRAILPEVCYLLQTRLQPRAELAFMRAVRDGDFELADDDAADLVRAYDLMQAFVQLPLGFVDAMTMALAERLDAREVLTTDRRHFAVAPAKRGWALVP